MENKHSSEHKSSEHSSKEYEVTFFTQTYGGDALGRLPDGRAVFTPFALPGEKVRLRLIEEKRGHARAELVEILQPSEQRIEPLCVHFTECGGCHYQHMAYETQLTTKSEILKDQLLRLGGLEHPPMRPIAASPQPFNYRNYVQFHLTPAGALGYHRARNASILAIQECHLPEPALNMLWPQLSFEPEQSLARIGLRCGADEDFQMILESSDGLPPELVVEELPLSVIHLNASNSLVLAGSETMLMQVLDKTFQVSAGSFFQVNTAVAGAMVNHIIDTLPQYQAIHSKTTFLDIYCGVGLFSAFLAEKVGRIVGIEASPDAAGDFVANLDAYDHIELYEAPAEHVLPGLELHPDLILVDPPRSGVDRRAMDELIRLNAPLLVYVSCDPATLGRDARRLTSGGYELAQITPFDMFPQTYHIESISFWIKKL